MAAAGGRDSEEPATRATESDMSNKEWPLYEVFIRSKSGLSHKHAGSIHAADDQMALERDHSLGSGGDGRILRARRGQDLPAPDVLRHARRGREPVNRDQALLAYVTRLGDNTLVLAQRMIELVAAYPELEEELANANFALDYIGQARMFYTYAGELEGKGRGEDDFAFLRAENEFRNYLLLEQPNGHFGDSITRLVLFDAFYLLLLEALTRCTDKRVAEIAARAEKEIRYHLRHNTQWLVRLGDGTGESRDRVQRSVDELWQYTGELFAEDETDRIFAESFNGPDLAVIRDAWKADIDAVLDEATLRMPEDGCMASGGKQGRHSEHFGYMIAEMQYLQRTFPGANW